MSDALTIPERRWLLRAAAHRELAPQYEAQLRAEADAIPEAVGRVTRGGLTSRQVEALYAAWKAGAPNRRVRKFERRG